MECSVFAKWLFSGVLCMLVLTGGGCSQSAVDQGARSGSSSTDNRAEKTHGAWWCVEHGIPEEDCSMCSAKVAKAFRAKGDWCDEHNRGESQCYQCDPARLEKYSKLYEAKFGKTPPKPVE